MKERVRMYVRTYIHTYVRTCPNTRHARRDCYDDYTR